MRDPAQALRANRKYWSTPRGKYSRHKANASRRGVPFSLTFEEWWGIWQKSGKWSRRGPRKGQYVMARFGDLGAYELGNVRIAKSESNTAERNRSVVDKLHTGLRITRSITSEEVPF